MRILDEQVVGDKKYIVLYYTSGETKPTTGIVMGSLAVEVDTGKTFLYNETADAWAEQ